MSAFPRTNVWIAAVFFALGCGLPSLSSGQTPPEILRVRVPRTKVADYFPPGTPVRMLPLEEFDKLALDATAAIEAEGRSKPPRIILSHHQARWESGVLTGRSELEVDSGTLSPVALVISPWSPPIVSGGTASSLRTRPNGDLIAWLGDSGVRRLVIHWRVQARTDSQGSVFELSLPVAPVSRLEIDLPSAMSPRATTGSIAGPARASSPGRAVWDIDGYSGQALLALESTASATALRVPTRPIIRANTRVDVREARSTWQSDWSIAVPLTSRSELEVMCDPTIRLQSVTGSDVLGFEWGGTNNGRERYVIRLSRSVASETLVSLSGTLVVPADGPWTVPTVEAVDCAWIGERALVAVGSGREVDDVRERAGVRVATRETERARLSPDSFLLAFERTQPGNLAQLSLRVPRREFAASVMGNVRVDRSGIALDVLMGCSFQGVQPETIHIEVPDAWMPDQVQILGTDEPTAWGVQGDSQGRTLIALSLAASSDISRPIRIRMIATLPLALGRELEMPRIRPRGAQIVEDSWQFQATPELRFSPVEARGVSWTDFKSTRFDEVPPQPDSSRQGQRLAWQWSGVDGRLRLAIDHNEDEPQGELLTIVRLSSDRARIDWFAEVKPTDHAGIVVMNLRPGDVECLACTVWSQDVSRPVVLERSIEAADDSHGVANTTRWRVPGLELLRGKGPVVLQVTLESATGGVVLLPRMVLNNQTLRPERVRISCDPNLLLKVESTGAFRTRARPIRSLARVVKDVIDKASGEGLDAPYLAAELEYDRPSGQIRAATERRDATGSDSLILESVLRSGFVRDGTRRETLELRVAASRSSILEIALPDGSSLVRAMSNGVDIRPIQRDSATTVGIPVEPTDAGPIRIALVYLLPAVGTTKEFITAAYPRFSVPCLASHWYFANSAREGPDLRGLRRGTLTSDSTLDLLAWQPWWLGYWLTDSLNGTRVPRLDLMNQRFQSLIPAPTTLGELLTRLDCQEIPLIIDRRALSWLGVGPEARFSASPSSEVGRQSLDRLLGTLGLQLVSEHGAFVLRNRSSRVAVAEPIASDGYGSQPAAPLRSIRGALVDGRDASDRLLSVSRWVADDRSAGRDPVIDPAAPDLVTFDESITAGEMHANTRIKVRDTVASEAAISVVAGIGSLFLVFGPLFLGRFRVPVMAAILCLGGTFVALGEERAVPIWLGTTIAWLGAIGFWAGRAWRHTRSAISSPGTLKAVSTGKSTTITKASPSLCLFMLCALSGVMATAQGLSAPSSVHETNPIIVLVPWDDPPDVAPSSQKAIVRLADVTRLLDLTREANQRREARERLERDGFGARLAQHRLDSFDGERVTIKSRYEIEGGDEPRDWLLPIGPIENAMARLDGREVAVQLDPGGSKARIRVEGSGLHQLEISQSLKVQAGEWARIPIASVAQTQCEGFHEAGAAESGVETGVTHAPTDSSAIAWVGSREYLLARRSGHQPASGPIGRLRMDALWDALPTGDRLRVRAHLITTQSIRSMTLTVDKDWQVFRCGEHAGPAFIMWSGDKEERTWTLQFARPLRDGDTLSLELWRPTRAEVDGVSRRTRPNLEFPGWAVETQSLALRSMRSWPVDPQELANFSVDFSSLELFQHAWGPLPEDDLVLDGLLTADALPRPSSLTLQRAPRRPRVTPAVHLTAGAGRLDVLAKARVTLSEASFAEPSEIEIPSGLQILRVDGEGLRAWSRPNPDRLRLVFDVIDKPTRTVLVSGWNESTPASVPAQTQQRMASIPWLHWPGARVEAGLLTIALPTPLAVHVEERPGLRRIDESEYDEVGPLNAAFEVAPGSAPGRIVWGQEASPADVRIESFLQIHATVADWRAVARYRVRGGPCREMRLELPQVWGQDAQVVLPDTPGIVHRTHENGRTRLVIQLDREGWGEQRVLLRGTRPIELAGMAFPDIVPLGLGQADTYLAWSDESGFGLVAEGTAGLQRLDASSLPLSRELGMASQSAKVYRVARSGWSLVIRQPSRTNTVGNSETGLLVDVDFSVTSDGLAVGETICALGPRDRDELQFVAPPEIEILGAQVDRRAVIVQRGQDAKSYSVRVEEPGAQRVTLWWRRQLLHVAKNTYSMAGVPLPLECHRVLVIARLPEGSSATPRASFLDRTSSSAFDRIHMESNAQFLCERIAKLNRDEPTSRAELLASLVAFELRWSVAMRALEWSAGGGPNESSSRQRSISLAQLNSARSLVTGALLASGLSELEAAMRDRIGPSADPQAGAKRLPSARPSYSLQQIGIPWYFEGRPNGSDFGLEVQFAPRIQGSRIVGSAIAALGALVLCLGLTLAARTWKGRIGSAGVGTAALLIALVFAPTLLLGLLPLATWTLGAGGLSFK